MTRKLSAMLAILATAVYIATWLVRKVKGWPVPELDEFLFTTIAVAMISFWLFGRWLAHLGVALVQEVIAERRSRDEEKRHRARKLYENALSEKGEDEGAKEASSENAPAA